MNSFNYEVKKLPYPDTFLCSVTGSLDISTTKELEQWVRQLIETGKERIIFDFSGLAYINSQGLGALLALQKSLDQKGGGVILVAANSRVIRILETVGMNMAIPHYSKLDEAFLKDPLFANQVSE